MKKLLLIFLLLVVYSCQKENHLGSVSNESVRNWYEKKMANAKNFLKTDDGKLLSINPKIKWLSIESFALEGGNEIYQVPIEASMPSELKNIKLSMVIYKNEEGYNYKIINQYTTTSKDQQERGNALYQYAFGTKKIKISTNTLFSANTNKDKLMGGVTQDPIGLPPNCTDWYWVTTYYDSSGNVIDETWDFVFTTCDGGGGGGGGLQDTAQIRIDTALAKLMRDHCLTTGQLETLNNTVNEYISGQGDIDWACVQNTIYNKVIKANKKIGFCTDPNSTEPGNGYYSSATGTIIYKSPESIASVTLFAHEFFHAYQDAHYAGGISQYNQSSNNRNGFPNTEFEQALFYDIVNGSSDAIAMGSGAPQDIVIEYKNWISTITKGNTKYPRQFSDFGSQYYYFLELFYRHSAYANIGSINNNLQPTALLSIFSISKCK